MPAFKCLAPIALPGVLPERATTARPLGTLVRKVRIVLIEVHDFYAALVRSNDDAIVAKDTDRIVVAWNPAAEQLFGYSAREMVEESIRRLLPADRQDEEDLILDRIRRGERVAPFFTKRLHKDGHLIDALITVSPVRDGNGTIVGASKIARDAAPMLESQRRVRESEERFRMLAENISQFAWVARPDGRVVWYNKRFHEFAGLTPEDLTESPRAKLIPAEHLARVSEHFERSIAAGEDWEDTFPMRGKDGELRWFLSHAKPIRDESGKITWWFGTNTDVTEQREQADQIQLLLMEVNHRSKNMLSTVQALARRSVGDNPRIHRPVRGTAALDRGQSGHPRAPRVARGAGARADRGAVGFPARQARRGFARRGQLRAGAARGRGPRHGAARTGDQFAQVRRAVGRERPGRDPLGMSAGARWVRDPMDRAGRPPVAEPAARRLRHHADPRGPAAQSPRRGRARLPAPTACAGRLPAGPKPSRRLAAGGLTRQGQLAASLCPQATKPLPLLHVCRTSSPASSSMRRSPPGSPCAWRSTSCPISRVPRRGAGSGSTTSASRTTASDTVRLRTRHWRITDSRGIVNLVDGEGVVGETPVLAPGATHDYVSGCELMTNMGSMEGHYTFALDDGTLFEVAIPFFPLAAPASATG